MKNSERSFARRIDLTSLQLFVAVCESGSIGRAAEREFIAASAISKRLAELEAAVDTPLLYRHSRGVKLTPAGENLLHHARTVLFGLEKMQTELGEYAGGIRGHVRMHANISAIVQFLPEDLGAFVRSHGQIKIDLEEHLSGAVLHAVQEGAADIGICHCGNGGDDGQDSRAAESAEDAGAAPKSDTAPAARGAIPFPRHPASGLQTRPYREDRLVLVMPQQHSLASQPSMSFAAALDCDIVGLHAGSSIALALQRAAAAAGKALKLRIQVTGLDAMCRMIDNGLGVGVLPDRAFDLMRGVGRLRAVPLTDQWARRQLRIVARDFAALPVTARLLVEHLTQTTIPTAGAIATALQRVA